MTNIEQTTLVKSSKRTGYDLFEKYSYLLSILFDDLRVSLGQPCQWQNDIQAHVDLFGGVQNLK